MMSKTSAVQKVPKTKQAKITVRKPCSPAASPMRNGKRAKPKGRVQARARTFCSLARSAAVSVLEPCRCYEPATCGNDPQSPTEALCAPLAVPGYRVARRVAAELRNGKEARA